MRKLDTDLGKIYHKNNFYYLEKIYDSLTELIEDEDEVKDRAKRNGFKIIKTNWAVEDNPYYYIETIMNDYETDGIDMIRYVFKLKLKYIK
tara:strand:+ start:1528 stop:1800 length:273 start_codon:yes stop_codon:yes gene_type:complete